MVGSPLNVFYKAGQLGFWNKEFYEGFTVVRITSLKLLMPHLFTYLSAITIYEFVIFRFS